jgi:glycosyltransferase involved in cell wall biosynthesis
MEASLKTTLFVPTFNEIHGVKTIMPRIRPEWVDEIIIVDGNSTDGTPEYLEAAGYRVIRQKQKGLAAAYWECFEACTGDVIIPFSPDNNSIPEVIPGLVAKMNEGYDMVIASRYAPGAKSEDDDVVTAFGNWMFTTIINILFRAKYTDTLVMYRAFRKDLVTRLELDQKKLPVLEALLCIRCAKRKLSVADFPANEPKRLGDIRKMQPLYNGASIVYVIIRELFFWR